MMRADKMGLAQAPSSSTLDFAVLMCTHDALPDGCLFDAHAGIG